MHTTEFLKNMNTSAKTKKEFENTIAGLSGAQMGSNHEENRGQKPCDTLPLNTSKYWLIVFYTKFAIYVWVVFVVSAYPQISS